MYNPRIVLGWDCISVTLPMEQGHGQVHTCTCIHVDLLNFSYTYCGKKTHHIKTVDTLCVVLDLAYQASIGQVDIYTVINIMLTLSVSTVLVVYYVIVIPNSLIRYCKLVLTHQDSSMYWPRGF